LIEEANRKNPDQDAVHQDNQDELDKAARKLQKKASKVAASGKQSKLNMRKHSKKDDEELNQ